MDREGNWCYVTNSKRCNEIFRRRIPKRHLWDWGIGENDLFCQLFLKWKSMVQMESDIRNHAIKRITALLEKRTGRNAEVWLDGY